RALEPALHLGERPLDAARRAEVEPRVRSEHPIEQIVLFGVDRGRVPDEHLVLRVKVHGATMPWRLGAALISEAPPPGSSRRGGRPSPHPASRSMARGSARRSAVAPASVPRPRPTPRPGAPNTPRPTAPQGRREAAGPSPLVAPGAAGRSL